MATPEPIEHSPRLVRAAQAERLRLLRDLDQAERQAAQLRESLAEAESKATQLRHRIAFLRTLTGDTEPEAWRAGDNNIVQFPDTESEPAHRQLKGHAIRRAAVRLLADFQETPRPIHYTEWYALLREAGYGVAGVDPLATFLTQIGRSPVVLRGDDAGTYVLDLVAPERLRDRLNELNVELLALHNGQQTIEEIASARDRRSELLVAITRIERALEEALDSLAPTDA